MEANVIGRHSRGTLKWGDWYSPVGSQSAPSRKRDDFLLEKKMGCRRGFRGHRGGGIGVRPTGKGRPYYVLREEGVSRLTGRGAGENVSRHEETVLTAGGPSP